MRYDFARLFDRKLSQAYGDGKYQAQTQISRGCRPSREDCLFFQDCVIVRLSATGISAVLHRFLGRDDHLGMAFAWGILSLHFQASGRTLKKTEFEDFHEALEAVCDELAQEVSGQEH